MKHFASQNRLGFTLMELLLAIGMLGVLSAIVLVAINPSKQLEDAQNAKRKTYVREQENAILQYMISNARLPVTTIPVSETLAKPICKAGVTDPSCINLDSLSPDYLVSLPMDSILSSGDIVTGYRVYQDTASRPRICSDYLPEGNDGRCSASTYVAEEEEEGGEEEAGPNCPQIAAAGGDGSVGNPYQLDSCTGIKNITSTGLGSHYVLTRDVDCSSTSYTPIGSFASPFTGTFNGNGCVINHLGVIGGYFSGLFAAASATSVIENVGVENAAVDGADFVGVIAGTMLGTLRNSYAKGNVSGDNDVGGLVGSIEHTGIIENSYADVDVTGDWSVGGLAGAAMNTAIIRRSFATGTVTGGSTDGGLIGYKEVGVTLTNDYWNDLPGNPTACYSGGTTGCTAIANDESHFYSASNAPLSSWDFTDIWETDVSSLPTLQ